MRGPDGGPLVPVKIEPADFHTTAQRFVDASNTLYQVLPSLFHVSGGFRGPAGVDNGAKRFDAAYHAAVQTLIDGVNRAVSLLSDIGVASTRQPSTTGTPTPPPYPTAPVHPRHSSP